jgi:phospholipid/cholesterol/gamma-HCH transport system substrate-binding protein
VETKANYILIGLFTIAGLLGIVFFSLWFARIELDRQFAYYDVRFSSVSGLSNASDVRFSGLPVGQVVDVRLSPDRSGTITVRLEVAADTPVRADSIATIESQGVTGVSFVGISAGRPEAPLLSANDDSDVPVIPAGRSTLQSLSEDAPELVAETLRVVQEIGDLFGGENQGRLDRILINVEAASDEFAATLEGFSGIAGTVNEFAAQIGRFNTTLDTLTGELAVVLASADETLASVGLLADQSTAIVASGTNTLDAVQGAVGEVERYIAEDLTLTASDVRDTLASLRDDLTVLRTDASALMATLGTTGTTATARLEEAAVTIAEIDALLVSLDTSAEAVTTAADNFDTLLTEQGTPLLVETRAAVAEATVVIQSISVMTENDLPGIIADLQGAVTAARATIDSVGADLTAAGADVAGLMAQAGTTLTTVTDTFANANGTLSAINSALETGQSTLVAAESAFRGADRLINEDISGLIAGLETSVEGLNAAVATVSDDLPEISADLREASAAASAAFEQVQTIVAASAPGVAEFTTTALPLYARLAQETRALIANLDRLTQQIGRDPARFLLNQDMPEFRR